jgi:hypothetical protein
MICKLVRPPARLRSTIVQKPEKRELMRIEIEVELSEQVEPDSRVETRRFSRDVEMELPTVGAEIELNVAAEPVLVTVTDITRDADTTPWHVTVKGDSLTFKSLREDERWIETLIVGQNTQ